MSMMVKCTKSMQTGEYNISLSMKAPKPRPQCSIQFIINDLPPSKRYGNIFTQSCIIIVCNSRFSRKNRIGTRYERLLKVVMQCFVKARARSYV